MLLTPTLPTHDYKRRTTDVRGSACENGSLTGGAARARRTPRSRRSHPTRGRPGRALTEELRTALREHKRALIQHVERGRRRLEEAASRGLVIKWAREPGYLSLHDPTSGEWHEVKASECLPSVVESARAHRRRRGQSR